MTGQRFIEIVDPIRVQKGWSKGEFCKKIGVSPNMYGNYANGSTPRYAVIEATEKCLGINFSDIEKWNGGADDDITDILESLRTRPDLDILLRKARNAPPSSVYSLVAQLEKEREGNL